MYWLNPTLQSTCSPLVFISKWRRFGVLVTIILGGILLRETLGDEPKAPLSQP